MTNESLPFAYFEGNIVPIEDAKISIMTNALQYGNAVLGGMRGYYNSKDEAIYIFRMPDHYKRFLSTVNIMGCAFDHTIDDLAKITIDLVKKNAPRTDVYFRPFAYAGHTVLGPNLANTILDFSLHMRPLGEYLPLDKGLSIMVSSWRRVNDNAIPARGKISGAYVSSSLARKEAYDNGFEEAIMLSEAGHVTEGTSENLFIVRDGVLITPGAADDILEGITRKSILEFAKDLHIPIEVRTIDRSELYIADEMFLSGTACQVAWVQSVDKRVLGKGKIGPVTEKLQKLFFEIVRGSAKEYSNLLTKVSI